MCLFPLHARLGITWVSGACGGQESDPLELVLKIIVSHHMGTGNQTQVLRSSSQFSSLLTSLCSPPGIVLRSFVCHQAEVQIHAFA